MYNIDPNIIGILEDLQFGTVNIDHYGTPRITIDNDTVLVYFARSGKYRVFHKKQHHDFYSRKEVKVFLDKVKKSVYKA